MEKTNEPLVSLITPCHNGAAHMMPYLNGVLSQTYGNVQYIFVNDGSTDETEEMILSAKDAIEAKGWRFVYVKQKHSGQAAAVNAALREVRGKYFSQIDSDDMPYPRYLEKYCDFLENHPDCKFCYARVAVAKENALDSPYRISHRHVADGGTDDFFNDLIQEINLPPLAFYMIDTKAFLDVARLPLYESKGGQNWQILLPMAYAYKCGYMIDVLATCVERNASHSRIASQSSDRQGVLTRILLNTVSRIDMSDDEKAFWYDKIISRRPHDSAIKLFGFIPLLKVRRKRGKAILRLFNFIPIAVKNDC